MDIVIVERLLKPPLIWVIYSQSQQDLDNFFLINPLFIVDNGKMDFIMAGEKLRLLIILLNNFEGDFVRECLKVLENWYFVMVANLSVILIRDKSMEKAHTKIQRKLDGEHGRIMSLFNNLDLL